MRSAHRFRTRLTAAGIVCVRLQPAIFVLFARLCGCKTPPLITPINPPEIQVAHLPPPLALLLVFMSVSLLAIMMVKKFQAAGGGGAAGAAARPAPAQMADDDLRFKQLLAVAQYYHAGSPYRTAVEKAQKQYPHEAWGVSIGKLSEVVTEFKKSHQGKCPREFSLKTFIDAIPKKVMSRHDGLNYEEIIEARQLFDQNYANWKACPNWEDWNVMLCTVKGKEPDFRFSFPYLKECAAAARVVPIKCSKANASRVQAVGDYRNHISCAATWIAATQFHSIARECMYSLDETSLLLEPQFSKEVAGLASKEAVDEARKSNIGLSCMASEKEIPANCKVVKILVLTGGGGQCPMKVIKIRDERITEEGLWSVHKTPDTEVFVHCSPIEPSAGESASDRNVRHANTILKRCVLKSIEKDMTRLQQLPQGPQKCSDSGFAADSQGMSQGTRSAKAAARKEKFSRAILTFDGDYPQLKALISATSPLAPLFRAAGIELFKWAGGCSGIQQPLDRGRSFFCLKSALKRGTKKSFQYQLFKDMVATNSVPEWAIDFEERLCRSLHTHYEKDFKGKRNATFNTYWRFICNFEGLSQYAFRGTLVQQSFAATGLFPYSMKHMLSSYCYYKSLIAFDPQALEKIKAAMPHLVEEAARTGYVSDETIDLHLWPLFCNVANPKYMKAKTESMPVNHRRCIWISNPLWLSAEFARIKAANDKVAADAAAKIARSATATKRKADKVLAEAAKRQRVSEYDPATWAPERSWAATGVFEPCRYERVDGSFVTCAAKTKAKPAHLATQLHKDWLAIIRPLEEQRRGAAAAPPPPLAAQSDSDSDSGDSNDSSHVPFMEGLQAVANAIDRADNADDFGGIFEGSDPISARLAAAAAADDDDNDDHDDD